MSYHKANQINYQFLLYLINFGIMIVWFLGSAQIILIIGKKTHCWQFKKMMNKGRSGRLKQTWAMIDEKLAFKFVQPDNNVTITLLVSVTKHFP